MNNMSWWDVSVAFLTVLIDQTGMISCDKKPNRVKDMKLLTFACILFSAQKSPFVGHSQTGRKW